MKRLVSCLAAALLCATLLPGSGTALAATGAFDFLGGELAAFADNFEAEPPVAVFYCEHTLGGGPVSYRWGSVSVRQMFDALSALSVGSADPVMTTDSDYVYGFVMADGRKVSLLFNQTYLERDGVRYNVAGDEALHALRFPGYDASFSMFDVFCDEAVSSFSLQFDETPPASLRFRQGDDAETETTDPGLLRSVHEALLRAEVTWVDAAGGLDITGARETALTFTMADGRNFPFTILTVPAYDGELRDYLAVTPPVAALGTQYYCLEGLDALFALPFDGCEARKAERGITDPLLPFYGEGMSAQLSLDNPEAFDTLTVTHTVDGVRSGEVILWESDYASVSDMLRELSGLSCHAPQAALPESTDACRFVFSNTAGKTCTLDFLGNCAVIPGADGSALYYPIEHSAIDDGGIMDVVNAELNLLRWKHEVDFQGDSKESAKSAAVLPVILVVLTLAAAAAAGVSLLHAAKKKRAAATAADAQKGQEPPAETTNR